MKSNPTAPENRLTLAQVETLMRLASQMSIWIKPVVQGKEFAFELSGEGFSEPEPVTLPLSIAYARLLSEVCSGLAPWIPFSPAEACETTLLGLGEDALNTAIRKYQYRLAMRFTTKYQAPRRTRRGRSGHNLFSSSTAPPAAADADVAEAAVAG